MRKIFLIFLMILCVSPAAWSLEASHQFQDVERLLMRVRQDSFPELQKKRLKLGQFQEADAYFQSNFNVPTLLSSAPEYVVEVNPALWQRGCPKFAVEGILAHELSHTLDYVEGGIPGIIGVGWQFLSFESLRRYEHRTDLRAIFRGYGSGLIAYRRWIYAQLTPAQLERKRAVYYQPHEILRIMQRLETLNPQQKRKLEKLWLASPPMTLDEMTAERLL